MIYGLNDEDTGGGESSTLPPMQHFKLSNLRPEKPEADSTWQVDGKTTPPMSSSNMISVAEDKDNRLNSNSCALDSLGPAYICQTVRTRSGQDQGYVLIEDSNSLPPLPCLIGLINGDVVTVVDRSRPLQKRKAWARFHTAEVEENAGGWRPFEHGSEHPTMAYHRLTLASEVPMWIPYARVQLRD